MGFVLYLQLETKIQLWTGRSGSHTTAEGKEITWVQYERYFQIYSESIVYNLLLCYLYLTLCVMCED